MYNEYRYSRIYAMLSNKVMSPGEKRYLGRIIQRTTTWKRRNLSVRILRYSNWSPQKLCPRFRKSAGIEQTRTSIVYMPFTFRPKFPILWTQWFLSLFQRKELDEAMILIRHSRICSTITECPTIRYHWAACTDEPWRIRLKGWKDANLSVNVMPGRSEEDRAFPTNEGRPYEQNPN